MWCRVGEVGARSRKRGGGLGYRLVRKIDDGQTLWPKHVVEIYV